MSAAADNPYGTCPKCHLPYSRTRQCEGCQIHFTRVDAMTAKPDRKACLPFLHRWTGYSQPTVVTNSRGLPELAQRRHCRKCNAVDYRRVGISNK